MLFPILARAPYSRSFTRIEVLPPVKKYPEMAGEKVLMVGRPESTPLDILPSSSLEI